MNQRQLLLAMLMTKLVAARSVGPLPPTQLQSAAPNQPIQDSGLGVKAAASKLRSMVKLVPSRPYAEVARQRAIRNGDRRSSGDTMEVWDMLLNGKSIGRAMGWVTPEGFRLRKSQIDEPYRGLGLGKKMYGEIMRQAPKMTMMGDEEISPAAQRVWHSLMQRPGSYTVTKNPLTQTTPSDKYWRTNIELQNHEIRYGRDTWLKWLLNPFPRYHDPYKDGPAIRAVMTPKAAVPSKSVIKQSALSPHSAGNTTARAAESLLKELYNRQLISRLR